MMCFKFCIALFAFVMQVQAEQCTTPNNETAQCISLYLCPILLGGLATQKPASIEFVSKSNCGELAVIPMVCCGSTSDFITGLESSEKTDKKKKYLLASRDICGYQHSDDYIHSTNVTSINDFPWLVRIQYKKKLGVSDRKFSKFKCLGSLISNRYVLTAANCLIENKIRTAYSVRLGEYHNKNDTDCVDEDPHYTECSEPVEDIGIEKVITHLEYNTINKTNDIALLRLNRTVSYTDYIRPICLPLPGSQLAKVGDILITSGWAAPRKILNRRPLIKKKIISELITNDDCTQGFHNLVFNATDNHICTKWLSNNTDMACNGDSGGPVMTVNKFQWQQEGIVLADAGLLTIQCAITAFPEIHTKVATYIDWIQANIKP